MSRNDIYFSCDHLNKDEPQTNKKGDIISILNCALKQNPGVVALYVCIVGGMNTETSLHTFCGVPISRGFYQPAYKGELCGFNAERFCKECEARGLTKRKAAKLFGISKRGVQDIFINRTRRKRRTFIEYCEKVLQLEHGSLLI